MVRSLACTLALLLVSCGSDNQGPADIAVHADAAPPLDAPVDLPDLPTGGDLADTTDLHAPELLPDLPLDQSTDTPSVPIEPGPVLLLDFEMRHPVSWSFLVDELTALGHTVVYRRFFPHMTVQDLLGANEAVLQYQMILVAAGNGPSEPSPRSRPEEIELLAAYAMAGGTLVLMPRHYWLDGYGGDTEWFTFNRILQETGSALRIQRNTAIGFVFQSYDGKPPHHVAHPAAYPGSLEWTLAYPLAYGSDSEPLGDTSSEYPFPAGVTATLQCDGDHIRAFAWTHPNVLLWQEAHSASPSALSIPLEAQPLVAVAPTQFGHVAVWPRSMAQLPVHTEYMSDKPILDLGQLDAEEAFARSFLHHLSELSCGMESPPAAGCHAGAPDGLLQPTSEQVETPYDPAGGPAVAHLVPLPGRPLPEAPPEPPTDGPSLVAPPVVPRTESVVQPPWYESGRARLGWLGYRPYDELLLLFSHAIEHGITSFVVTIDSQWLHDVAAGAPPGPELEALAAAAAQTGATVLLGVNFLAAQYDAKTMGRATGPLQETINAPPPLHEAYWEAALRPLFIGAATAASQLPSLTGLHIDMELYGAGMLWYPQGLVFDDDTWARALAALTEAAPALAAQADDTPPYERLDWLVEEGLVGLVYEALREETAARVAALRDEARTLHQPLEMAFYGVQLSTSWFTLGWLDGLGTAKRPVTHLTYDIATTRARQVLAGEGIHARILGGCLANRFGPDDLEEALFHAGDRSDGYWLFQIADFPPPALSPDPPPLHGDIAAFWQGITQANERLDGQPAP